MLDHSKEEVYTLLSRRKFAGGLLAVAALSVIPHELLAAIPKKHIAVLKKPIRTLAFNNLHTGESTKLVYWEKGHYVKGALKEVNYILRDHRSGDVARIDKELLDKLFLLHNRLGSKEPYQVISGYRSPKTNALMHANSDGVAKHSMHTEGKAIDIRLEDAQLMNIRNAALAMNSGGVGYYPESQFVHIDTGKIRHWG